ncbi:MAG: hypothetical protein Q8P12_06130 [bacterium]|nr:hypothetical protein [bacterium]
MNGKRLEVFFEFLVFGIVIGVLEDVIAVKVVTGEPITLRVLGIIFLIAIPFAVLGELVVDRVDFTELFLKIFRKRGRIESAPRQEQEREES